MVERFEPNFDKGGGAHRSENGSYVRYSDYAELEAEVERLTKETESYRDIAARKSNQVADMIRAEALSRTGAVTAIDPRHFDILVEAMAEVKATSDGLSDQPIADIVQGCIGEIAALEPAASAFDECVASGRSCEYEPQGPNGEDQCRYCGKPAPPEGQQPVAWRYRFVTSIYGDLSDWYMVDDLSSIPPRDDQTIQPLFTRPSEQAVAEAIIDKAVVEAIHALRVEQPGRAYDILKAAMEAGRHD